MKGDAEFFQLTKLLHHRLYGSPHATGVLDDAARAAYAATTAREAARLCEHVQRGDTVVLHDPQTLGMAAQLKDAGAKVIWRLHVGTRAATEETSEGWNFLRPHLAHVSHCVLSVAGFAPVWMDRRKIVIMPPAIDPESAKNRSLSRAEAASILASVGLTGDAPPQPRYSSIRAISRVIQDTPLPDSHLGRPAAAACTGAISD